ncbi:MAG: DUF177 domain-containing protein [Bacteroidota bacterium]|nr:DUF177 domain-containing protein [Bacteroidota bacterium]
MGNRRRFDIAFVGLKPGVHEFNYEVDEQFFSEFGQTDFESCQATVKVQLEKSTSFMRLKFEIGGSVRVTCDRCGNSLPLNLWDEFNMIVKSVENPDEMNESEEDPDILYISRTESHLHLANWIYEFVSLSIPMQRMCSVEEMGGPQCNKEILEMLKKMESGIIEHNNPLQEGLEKLKKNNK